MNINRVQDNNASSNTAIQGNSDIDISGANVSQVIVSNLGATSNFCQLCGMDVPDINSHFGVCPNEPGQAVEGGLDVDLINIQPDDPPQLESRPQVANRIIAGDRINNMEYLLRCMRNYNRRM